MTVQELIEALQAYDPTMRVMVDGYEGGLCDVSRSLIDTAEVALDIEAHKGAWYYGPHEYANGYGAENSTNIVTALILGR